ncbi:MAG: PLxRFG domain-containing protein, partial [Porphyromonadaceae bacterium]|nr:PLxRFG domain-containing protein [Porphyromonadaceae bacterium]
KGPMNLVTDLSIASRTGINDLWWREPNKDVTGDDLSWHYVQQILGPVAGIGINLVRGTGKIGSGDVQRGIEMVLPVSIRNVSKAYRQAIEGEQTSKGDIILDDISAWNIAMQALGFGSAQMADIYDARGYIKGKEERISKQRSKLLTRYYLAKKDGNSEEVEAVLNDIRAFNATHHPTERITGKSLALSLKSQARSDAQTQQGVYLKKSRAYLRSEGTFAQTGK